MFILVNVGFNKDGSIGS